MENKSATHITGTKVVMKDTGVMRVMRLCKGKPCSHINAMSEIADDLIENTKDAQKMLDIASDAKSLDLIPKSADGGVLFVTRFLSFGERPRYVLQYEAKNMGKSHVIYEDGYDVSTFYNWEQFKDDWFMQLCGRVSGELAECGGDDRKIVKTLRETYGFGIKTQFLFNNLNSLTVHTAECMCECQGKEKGKKKRAESESESESDSS